ncbi:MAG: diguanylate cyclase [Oscillospiraceae bacterium]
MENSNLNQKKRRIIIVSGEFAELKKILDKKYDTVLIDKSTYSFDYIIKRKKHLGALIISNEKAVENDYEIFRLFEADPLLSSVPIIIYCHNLNEAVNAEPCLEHGAADIIYPPFSEKIFMHKIACCIRLKNSATFYEIEHMLKVLPSNIYLKDAEGRYVFATHYWHHLDHTDDPDWTIRGKTDIDIRKDKDNAAKAMEADMEIFRTGKGTAYTIEINADNQREFMEVIKQPLYDNDGNVRGIVGLINNVTERELLRISLEESAMMDELTHVYNRRFFEQYSASVDKSRQYPVSIISADCNDLKQVNDTYGHLVGDEYIRMTALLFRTNIMVQHKGRIFRVGGDEFVIVLTETTLYEAEQIIEKLKDEAKHFSIKNKSISISYGVACIENDALSFNECFDIADKKMYENKAKYKQERSKMQK